MQEFLNKILCGDCIGVLGKVGEPFADLIFADPPFNIGHKYDKYYDKVKSKNYIAWTKEWMAVCKRVLKLHGSFVRFINILSTSEHQKSRVWTLLFQSRIK